MIYKTFEEWKAGQWLEDGELRTEAYTEDELLLIEMGWQYGFDAGAAKTITDEEIINIIERLIAKWTDEFKNYENDSDIPEENKLRDDVFAILRKASGK